MAIGRPDEAVASVRRALDIDPLSSVLNASLGMILYLARRMEGSHEALRKGLEIDPGHFLLHFRRGLVLMQMGAPGDAIEDIERAVELSGGSTETLAGLAQADARAGMPDAMEQLLAEILRQSER